MRYFLTSVRIIAIVGIVLHAGLLVRHNSSVLAANLQASSLFVALAEICHGGGVQLSEAPDIPQLPPPGGDSGSCPICKGCVAAAAVLPTVDFFHHSPLATVTRMEIVGEAIALRLARILPPARAPPRTA